MNCVQMVRSRASSRMSSQRGSMENLADLSNDAAVSEMVDAVSDALASGGLSDTTHHKVGLFI